MINQTCRREVFKLHKRGTVLTASGSTNIPVSAIKEESYLTLSVFPHLQSLVLAWLSM